MLSHSVRWWKNLFWSGIARLPAKKFYAMFLLPINRTILLLALLILAPCFAHSNSLLQPFCVLPIYNGRIWRLQQFLNDSGYLMYEVICLVLMSCGFNSAPSRHYSKGIRFWSDNIIIILKIIVTAELETFFDFLSFYKLLQAVTSEIPVEW